MFKSIAPVTNFFDHKQVGIYLPCYDIFRNWIEDFTRSNAPGLTPYAPLVAGSVARSLACIACSPIELARTRMQVHLHVKFFYIRAHAICIVYSLVMSYNAFISDHCFCTKVSLM
jgi:hypothetical protein